MKHKSDKNGTVYSTNPNYAFDYGEEEVVTLEPAKQNLRIMLDKKQRAGKKVTLITGFQGSEFDLAVLGKELKSACGVGGSVKDGEILLQGDFREKVLALLLQKGYSKTKISGL
ncbi:MAG: translation initiation factor [Bacteroidales bacterium]|jgi:translation initiation factor 1|nr:translation initiation factor [Bacteroidales bacterium]MBR3426984.1 translation initiation factor [Bacteroidales bacterium]